MIKVHILQGFTCLPQACRVVRTKIYARRGYLAHIEIIPSKTKTPARAARRKRILWEEGPFCDKCHKQLEPGLTNGLVYTSIWIMGEQYIDRPVLILS
jgi:hypothetical protein